MNDQKIKKIIIAIDGVAGAGKSTTAKQVAKTLGYLYINSGSMYRAITLKFMTLNLDPHQLDSFTLQQILDKTEIVLCDDYITLDGLDVSNRIKMQDVATATSYMSTHPLIRAMLIKKQQAIGSKKGVVMDGRDIGTIVFPNAELKIFMTANSEIRAKRRTAELDLKSNTEANFTVKKIKYELETRDNQDTTRKQSALVKAYDAIVIDTSHLTFDEQVDMVLKLVKERT